MHPAQKISLGVSLAALLQGAATGDPGLQHVAVLPQHDLVSNLAQRPSSVALSADGRYVAFVSRAQLVEADTNVSTDIYVFDTVKGDVTLETLTPAGQAASGDEPWLDGSGRYLVFASVGAHLVAPPLPAGPHPHIFLRDRLDGTTRLLSVDRHGRPANDMSREAVISHDGRTVAFSSSATTLVAGDDKNGRRSDVYLLRVASGAVERVSVTSAGDQLASGESVAPSLSGDGRLVAFTSTGPLACPANDTCGHGRRMGVDRAEVFVHDTQVRRTISISRSVDGGEPNGASFHPAISADGRFVAFASNASNLVAKDRNGTTDVFVADLEHGSIELVSRTSRGRPGNGRSRHPVISGDGSLVLFQSEASDLVCASRCQPHERDINMVWDVFLHDRRRGTVVRLSTDGGAEWMEPSAAPVIAPLAPVAAFRSLHPVDSRDDMAAVNAFLLRLPG